MQLCVDYSSPTSSRLNNITQKATTYFELKEYSLKSKVQKSQSCTWIKGPQTTR